MDVGRNHVVGLATGDDLQGSQRDWQGVCKGCSMGALDVISLLTFVAVLVVLLAEIPLSCILRTVSSLFRGSA